MKPCQGAKKINLNNRHLLFVIVIFIIGFGFSGEALAQTYYASGTLVSKNLLAGVTVSSIDKFGYNASSIPASTTLKVQFSRDRANWYDSAGTLNAWNTLSQGDYLLEVDAISLSALNWSGPYFYYKMQFETTDTSQTPVLDEVRVYYTPQPLTATYYSSGTLVSKNLLAGAAGVNKIGSFYTSSVLPTNTILSVQFSTTGVTWYSADGILNGSTSIPDGQAVISLTPLNWSGSNFYYKIKFETTDTGKTPVLDEIGVNYNVYLQLKGGVKLKGGVILK